MTQMTVHEFANRSDRDVPHLFSQTRGFRFFGDSGLLKHVILPRGPRGITVVAVTSTGHEAGFTEEHRTALTLPLVGSSEISVADRTFTVRPGEMFAIGPSARRSKLFPPRILKPTAATQFSLPITTMLLPLNAAGAGGTTRSTYN